MRQVRRLPLPNIELCSLAWILMRMEWKKMFPEAK